MAAAYVGFAELGFSLAFTTKQVTAVWPPTGVAVAALLLGGLRLWPGVFAGAFVGNALTGEPLWAAAAIATGNTAGPALATLLLRRLDFSAALQRARDVIAIIAVAAASMTVTATNGVSILALAGLVPWHAYSAVWLLWWAGDAMGVLVVAPVLLTFAVKRPPTTARRSPVELTILFIALIAVTWMGFVSPLPVRLSVYPLIVWIALRFGLRETTSAIVVITAISVWGTAHQLGAFGGGTVDQRLLSVMSFVATFAATGLLLAATTCERQTANERLIRAVETLQSAFLPRELPKRPGVHIDGLYLAAGSEALIGGDWYDAFERPDGSIVISMGDVVGHGLAAAVSAGKLRQAIFTTAFDCDDPAEMLERVNRSAAGQGETIATALVAVLDASLHQMRFATAGHPPPILATPAAPPRSLEIGGVPLGVAREVKSIAHDVTLTAGSLVLFYTDGLTEFGHDPYAGEIAAGAALAALASSPVRENSAATIQRAVMGTAAPADDVAIVVVSLA